MRTALILIFFMLPFLGFSQIDEGNLMGMPRATTISELNNIQSPDTGSIAYVDDEKSIYLFDSQKWIRLLSNSPLITNELIFDNEDFIYVSVVVNDTNWLVTRYHKDDINTETIALGSGSQPASLPEVAGLSYN